MSGKPPRKDNPSSIFYWKDYENDEGLRISSLAAQGLWMRLLCLAAKADPYGYMLVNGFPLEPTGASRLAGVTEAEAQTLLAELERNGVFSRDRKGRMFSRRLVKEAKVRKISRENGKKGGNPALSASEGKQTGKDGQVNPMDNPPLKPPYPLPHSHTQKEEEDLPAAAVATPRDAAAAAAPTDRELILQAIGVDPISGMTGRGGAMLGKQADIAEVARWLDLPGLTIPIICEEIRRIMVRRKGVPPASFRFFTEAMAELSGALDQAPLTPIAPSPGGSTNGRHATDRTIAILAAGLSAGTVTIDTSNRDPFAIRPGPDHEPGQHGPRTLLRS